jgi:hypothetical protein
MTRADLYLLRAKECFEQADRATVPGVRERWERLARQWERLAHEAQGTPGFWQSQQRQAKKPEISG